MAPRMGPEALSHVIGGPACRSKLSFIPGITSRALPSPTRTARASIILSVASAFAFSIFMGVSFIVLDSVGYLDPITNY